jgi:hypothetical protein
MKNIKFLLPIVLSTLLLSSCGENDGIDTEKPSIDLSIQDAFPINCDTLYFGESFDFNALLSDNAELGSFSIDIHNNFDHHSHSTEVTACSLDEIKSAVNPLVFIEDYDIPTGETQYQTNLSMLIPSSDGNDLYDEGDYHFFISLTDKDGWSTQKGLSIKVFYR